MKVILTSILLVFTFSVFGQKKDYLITLKTEFGNAQIILFDETPLHKQNFIKLVKTKFYDDLLFHRVIKGFMIQGGDPTSKIKDANIGNGGSELDQIPFEFNPKKVHIKGTLAAARDNDPEKKSSGCQFYIVQGKKIEEFELKNFELKNNMKYTTKQKVDYMILGGAPFLDNNYTVFGTLINNFDLIDKIASMPTNSVDRPINDIKMSFEIKKMRKKKITKKYKYTFD